MQRINQTFFLGLEFGILLSLTACQSGKMENDMLVTLDKMSVPARTSLLNATRGGTIDKITREIEHGKVVYDAEAIVGGKHVEYLVADSDGQILGTENEIDFAQLPEPVRVAAERFFSGTKDLKAMKGVEFGKTQYEVEGVKHGKVTEVTFTPDGKIDK